MSPGDSRAHRPDHVVVRDIRRADAGQVAELGTAGVATVHEAAGKSGLLRPYLRPIYAGAAVAGPAVTVLCQPGDNLMIHLAVELCRPGDVLVVAVASDSTDGMLGELLATSLRAHGVAGVVIDAGVRDSAELARIGFPVWARAVSARGTFKASPGSVNVPVVCAGQAVHPGDAVVADDDGVVCVPAESAAEVARRANKRIAGEASTREKLQQRVLGADLYNLRETAAALGIEYVDGPDAPGDGR